MKKKKNNILKRVLVFFGACVMIMNLNILLPVIYAQADIKPDCSTLSVKINIGSEKIHQVFKEVLSSTGSNKFAQLNKKDVQTRAKAAINEIGRNSKYVVLFLCNANQERSPMAEKLMNMKMSKDLAAYFVAESAGLLPSNKADFTLMSYLERHPLLRNHAPKQVSEYSLKKAKIIFVMTPGQKKRLIRKFPFVKDKVFLLMGDDEIHGVAGDYAERGPSYKILEKTIKDRLPILENKLRQILVLENSETSTNHANALGLKEDLINTAI